MSAGVSAGFPLGRVARRGLCVLAIGALAGMAGCVGQEVRREAPVARVAAGAPERTRMVIPGDLGEQAYAAAMEALLSRGFRILSADARGGVILSEPKRSAGLLTPWDVEQASMTDELEDTLTSQRRTVRVTISRPAVSQSGVSAPGPAAPTPAREDAGDADALEVGVTVTVERRQRPGVRLETETVRQRSTWLDPQLAQRGMQPVYWVASREDPSLAAILLDAIERDLGLPGAGDAAGDADAGG